MSRRVRPADHGDYAYAQKHGCKCVPCRQTRRIYAKGLRLDAHRGVVRKVPIERVQSHLSELIERGITRRQIIAACEARVSRTQLLNIVRGHNSKGTQLKFVHRGTARDLLGVTYEMAIGQEEVVPAIGIHRRVHALNRLGHTASEIAAYLGISHSQVYTWMIQSVANKSSVAAIHRAYEHLASVQGSNEWVRWRAIRNEYAPPMAWEDDQLDELEGEPDWTWVPCAVEGCLRKYWRTGLCRVHHLAVEGRGGFREGRRFREVVTSQHRMDKRRAA